ncbi:helix-turn-helix domain-containing protein [Limosilactobacillus fermentum]|uniref:helix-turn-helix domain-containing protein n=1 Tax=Limosilactobacillus fermentum TaxID=1613 RepID=UPI0021C759B0|nr:helix-turn-helix transcriptional regulator [Limosilactobacillus fermentum]MDC6079178.1 helix-turn-helix transcriptional regulator [Limosilactobacillus fermentum]
MIRQNRSIYWLAKQTGILDNTLYQYKNKGVEPSFRNACRIADALQVSLLELREDGFHEEDSNGKSIDKSPSSGD